MNEQELIKLFNDHLEDVKIGITTGATNEAYLQVVATFVANDAMELFNKLLQEQFITNFGEDIVRLGDKFAEIENTLAREL